VVPQVYFKTSEVWNRQKKIYCHPFMGTSHSKRQLFIYMISFLWTCHTCFFSLFICSLETQTTFIKYIYAQNTNTCIFVLIIKINIVILWHNIVIPRNNIHICTAMWQFFSVLIIPPIIACLKQHNITLV
jgi:hypothetical protein